MKVPVKEFIHCLKQSPILYHANQIIYKDVYWLIGLEGRVFAKGPGDRGSIPGCVISNTLKMVLDSSLLNTQKYKVRIKGKVEQSMERTSVFPKSQCCSY